jgi:hypothetical protein
MIGHPGTRETPCEPIEFVIAVTVAGHAPVGCRFIDLLLSLIIVLCDLWRLFDCYRLRCWRRLVVDDGLVDPLIRVDGSALATAMVEEEGAADPLVGSGANRRPAGPARRTAPDAGRSPQPSPLRDRRMGAARYSGADPTTG